MGQLGQLARDEAAGGCRYKQNGCDAAIAAWDGAAAVYVGSLEGADGNNDPGGSYGKAPYALADKRCRNYRNCGPGLDEFTKDVTSNINTKILSLFSAGSLAAWEGDYNQLDKIIRLISNKAAVPLIQGTLRYYWRLSDEEGVDTFSVLDKEVGEGGAFISVPCRSFGLAPLVESRRPKLSPRSEEELPVYRQLTSKTSSSPSSATTAASASPALRSVNSTMTTAPLPPNPEPMRATTRTTVPIAPALSPTRTRRPSASSSPENPESRTETSSDSPSKPLSHRGNF